LVQSVPVYSPKKIVQIIKSITAREIFRLCPEVKKKLWGGELLVSLVVVENRFFGIGAQIFLSQLPYNERSLNSQRLSIPPSRGFQR